MGIRPIHRDGRGPPGALFRAAGLVVALLAGCNPGWLPNERPACIHDRECPEGEHCINGECVDIELVDPDDPERLKEFGERCGAHDECRSTYCLPHPAGDFCTRPCAEGCPTGWACRQVPDPRGGAGTVALCAAEQRRLCATCLDDWTCNVTGSDLCLELDDGRYCAADCTYADCPVGYTCQEVDTGTVIARQCLPDHGGCQCTAAAAGLVRTCERENAHGTCQGIETCDGETWSDCTALSPAPEQCNGLDDDCDTLIDEDLTAGTCARENAHGTCTGPEVCAGFEGWVCGALEPGPEACDGLDNDCNGTVDDGFHDAAGRYLGTENCGSCGVDCVDVIPQATATECRLVDDVPVCRATACATGYFLYLDGAVCLALPANLCEPCSGDADCLAPGSRCLDDGLERYCGRDCTAGSPYGQTCPEGYLCDLARGGQCRPTGGSCHCTAGSVGTVRSCLVDVCTGYQECQATRDGHAWSPCNVEDFNVEICDGLDNNCNGQIDEGFLDPLSGRYVSDAHCGFCHHDCALLWTPETDHVDGVCDAGAAPLPACVMGPCRTEVEDGATYEWVDVNGDPEDGCECRRRLGTQRVDEPDEVGWPEPGLEFHDENCDGVDGVVDFALFVRAGASDGDGSRDRPFGTLAEALAAWPTTTGKRYLLVAEGRYDEDIALLPGVALHGGYAADFAHRDVVLHASVLTGQTAYATVTGRGIREIWGNTVISGLVIQGRDAVAAPAAGVDGRPSVAVQLVGCDHSVILRGNRLLGGRGGDGGRGATGAAGYGRQESLDLDGGAGLNGERLEGPCLFGGHAGGAAGRNASCDMADGHAGASTSCPRCDPETNECSRAPFDDGSEGNGVGGSDWRFDEQSTETCSHVTEAGFPDAIQLNEGQDGQDGPDGASGAGGAGGAGRFGSLREGRWVSSPEPAADGEDGQSGDGGGGGGGGGGVAHYAQDIGDYCNMHELGPSGGGAGAGGCGGAGGRGGRQGGASFVVVVVGSDPTAQATVPVLRENVLQRAPGGQGGDGGFGGMGGLGGRGGFGGGQASWVSTQAGKGGDGGNGGPGGGGGGGAGGPSFDVLGLDADTAAIIAENLFEYADEVPTGGAGGSGGSSVGLLAPGQPGLDGAFGVRLELRTCAAGGQCAPGTTCDANEVCVPYP